MYEAEVYCLNYAHTKVNVWWTFERDSVKESKKSLQSDTRLREEAKNQASGWGDLQSGKWQENAK